MDYTMEDSQNSTASTVQAAKANNGPRKGPDSVSVMKRYVTLLLLVWFVSQTGKSTYKQSTQMTNDQLEPSTNHLLAYKLS